MFRILLVVLALAAAMAGLLVGTLNPDPLSIDILFAEFRLPAGVALLASFSVGLLCGLVLTWLLFGLPGSLRRRRRRKKPGSAVSVPETKRHE